MKLRNKKTGEIGELQITEKHCAVAVGNGTTSCGIEIYNSLAELNEEWEDYEEPKDSIDYIGLKMEDYNRTTVEIQYQTKEEAEKAVEKLKAWKRLKDKGLTFCAWKITDDGCSVDVETTLDAEIVRAKQKYITDDLNILFGGEE